MKYALKIRKGDWGMFVFGKMLSARRLCCVLLFALDKDVCPEAAAQFEKQQVEKTYLAVVRGHPDECGIIDHPLTRQFDDYEFRAANATTAAQEAITRYRRLAVAELPHAVDRYPTSRYALVELMPQTGRRHQIRRHLKHIAHPIVGDATYGKGRHNRLFQDLFNCHRLLLACLEMRLNHPVSGIALTLRAPLADDFASVIGQLGWPLPQSWA